MTHKRTPVTPAIRALREARLEFEQHLYDYTDKGGTRHSAEALGVDEHLVIKTLVMQDEDRSPLVVLMHGDLQVSEKGLARLLGKKAISPCDPAIAQKHTGYQVGGTSPFGTRKQLPVYAEESIFELGCMYINGGKRGFLVCLDPKPALLLIGAKAVRVAVGPSGGG